MTPQEKAKELVYKTFGCKKHYAKLAVDEILKELEELLEGNERPSAGVYYLWEYYKEVKKEIEKL